MTLSADFAQNLKMQADIVRVVGDYVSLKKSGAQNYSGLCPFHKEKTPSFSVHATKQFYYCFGCGEKGDVFKFIQKIENITFPEAVRAVAQKIGVALPKATFSSEAEAKDARRRTALLEIHERACGFFQECLRRPEGARARSEEHTSELQSRFDLVCRLLLEKKKNTPKEITLEKKNVRI